MNHDTRTIKTIRSKPNMSDTDRPSKYDRNATFYFANDCELSNDPPSNGNINLGICNRTQYICSTSSESSNNPVEIEIPYEYEVLLNPQSNSRRVLLYLEESMLEHLANYMGLTTCQTTRRRQTSLVYIGIDISPPDIATNTSCGNDIGNTKCVSMQGGVTVFPKRQNLSDDEKRSVTSDVLTYIQSSMDRDVFTIPGVIEKVAFVNRTTEPSSSTEDIAAVESGLPKIYIGLIVGLGIPLLIIAIFLCWCCRCRCRRRNKKQKERAISLDDEKVMSEKIDTDQDTGKQRTGEPLAEYDSLALQRDESEDVLSVHGAESVFNTTNGKEAGDDKSASTSVNTSHTSMISLSPHRNQPSPSESDSLLISDSDEEDIVVQKVESSHLSTEEVGEVFAMEPPLENAICFISLAATETSQTLQVDDIVQDDFVTTEDIIADLETNESGMDRPTSPHSLCTRLSQATTLLAGTNRRHDDDSLLQMSSIDYDARRQTPHQIDEVHDHVGLDSRDIPLVNLQRDDNLYGNNSYFDDFPKSDGSESDSDDTDATPRRRLQMG